MIWRVAMTQLRLSVRGWSFWLVLITSLALTATATRGVSLTVIFFNFGEFVFPFFLLGQMLLVAAAMQLERSDRVEELLDALPYRPGGWVLGRYLLHYGLWLIASVLLWVLAGAMVHLAGDPVDYRLLATNWVVAVPITLAFTTALGMAAGSLAGGMAVYFVTVFLWAAGPIGMLFLAKSESVLFVPFLEYYASGRFFPLGAHGYFPNGLLLVLNRMIVVAMTAAVIGLVLRQLYQRRGLPGRGASALVLISLVGVLVGVSGSQALWRERTEAMAAELRAAPLKERGSPLLSHESPFAEGTVNLDRYDLHLRLVPKEHRLDVTASFDVVNPGAAPVTEVVLTLRTTFDVTAVADEQGRSLPFERSGDQLAIATGLGAGEATRLTLDYGGTVWQWRPHNGPKLAAHVAPESLFLPANYGWYPVPGAQTPTHKRSICQWGPGDCEPVLYDAALYHAPATFQVTTEGVELNLVSNAGDGVTGLFLVGTSFETVRLGGITEADVVAIELTVAPVNSRRAEQMAAHVAMRAAQYEALVPLELPVIRIIEVPDTSIYGGPWTARPEIAPGAMLIHSMEVGHYTDRFLTGSDRSPDMVSAIWWPVGRLPEADRLLFIGFSAYMEQAIGTPMTESALPFQGKEVLQVLTRIEEAKGQSTAMAILREMRARLASGGPTVAEFIEAVEAMAGDLPDLKEPLQAIAGRAVR